MLGENQAQGRVRQAREGAVDERGVVVCMHDARAMLARQPGEREAEARVESGLASQRMDLDAARLELWRPGAALVETAHSRGHVAVQALGQRHHKAFGAAGVQTEDDLEQTGTAGHLSQIGRQPSACGTGSMLESSAIVRAR
jgi:hypothetical protein